MDFEAFESRKKDHIRLSLMDQSQSKIKDDWGRIQLRAEALPEFNFEDIQLGVTSLGKKWTTPFFVSSMTAGHGEAKSINEVLAEACQYKGWMLGVGSQRRELDDLGAGNEWTQILKGFPKVTLASNIGISQLISTSLDKVKQLVENTQACMLFVHLNPLQECIQLEGTPHFSGALQALERTVRHLNIPVVVKEVGSGLASSTAKRVSDVGVQAIDISGRGGTHWGKIEGMRAPELSRQARAAVSFENWGESTPKLLKEFSAMNCPHIEYWASGGIRNGVQALKSVAMGARRVGLARPFLQTALQGVNSVIDLMEQLEFELKIGLFCTGAQNIQELEQRKVWVWETE